MPHKYPGADAACPILDSSIALHEPRCHSESTANPQGGISWPIQEGTSDPVAQFIQPGSVKLESPAHGIANTSQKLSWHYNWNKNWDELLPGTTPGLTINAEFVPMIFAPGYLDNEFRLQDGWKLLLGYNEPDHEDPNVAVRTTPEEAARASADIQKWFSLIPPETKPDVLAIHVYTTTFDSFRQKVEEYYRLFGLPIIVTEFAMTSFDPNVPPPASQQQVHDFMGQTTAWLDATPWVDPARALEDPCPMPLQPLTPQHLSSSLSYPSHRHSSPMPRAIKQSPLLEQKPYSRMTSTAVKSEEGELLPDVKLENKNKQPASGKSKGRPWTAAELLALFDIVGIPSPNAKAFEGRIEGRSGYQCQQTWRNTVLPYLRKALQEKPGLK
ncbi:hypothetical protein A1Q1_00203 [Trichosporon asahii var. asahii CBS 2479]|uniref:Asl1-like glycosyl hydrolase catalytic domain-containing protein n=1 Tax=Trichosporon asahii var. asahii (strain ATCC 90039 / CBS 2479 / JCM 2466 / KCTC 7840 / NBRC 103889/ NCYC 2677 / UAMH 7654) TaxID=1186058 RepID=J4UGE0_TRIAS|nr:hypothetical protein A1Q1_00203 [Trichosporon asahii var. asahii CBS 2479]EJT50505.1 hypothetical protein A1Q1_00203 [Trichosporon asahii var. asahii CBS 2479]